MTMSNKESVSPEPGRSRKWSTILAAILGATGGGGLIAAVIALGGLKGYVSVVEYSSSEPRKQWEAISQSYKDEIATLDARPEKSPKDEQRIDDLRLEFAGQAEAFRAQQGVVNSVPRLLNLKRPTLAGKEAAELRAKLEIAQRLIWSTAEDYWVRGNGFFDVGDYDRALEAYDKSIDRNPNEGLAYYNRGVTRLEVNRNQKALEDLDRAIKLHPPLAQVHDNRGIALGRLKRFDEALEAHDEAIKLNPNDPVTHFNRGLTLAQLERPDEALIAFDQAIKLDPYHPMACYTRAWVLIILKQGDQALQSLSDAIRINPGLRGDARNHVGFAYLRDHPEYGPRFWKVVGKGKESEDEDEREEGKDSESSREKEEKP